MHDSASKPTLSGDLSRNTAGDTSSDRPLISVVVIGRNEGQRLIDCLQSVFAMNPIGGSFEVIYVDSHSTDGSPEKAAAMGARVLTIEGKRLCAASGRNTGWQAALGEYILFLDGDTILHPDFPMAALRTCENPQIAIVWGHRRESRPKDSIYNRVLDIDWIVPDGETTFCGGDIVVRRSALAACGGYDESLIAGEEPEMCRRLRAMGLKIMRIKHPMTTHDMAMFQFNQYWRRAVRSGHAYAEVSTRFRTSPDPFWRDEAQRNLVRGGIYSAITVAGLLALVTGFWAVAMTLAALVAAVTLRTAWRTRVHGADWYTCLLFGIHSHFQQIPILIGQLGYYWLRWRGKRRELIEYKGANNGATS